MGMTTANAPRSTPSSSCCRLAARRLVARAAADVFADQSSPAAVRKALLARGWDLAWIDGVTGEMIKGRLSASVPQIEAAVGAGGVRGWCRAMRLPCCARLCPSPPPLGTPCSALFGRLAATHPLCTLCHAVPCCAMLCHAVPCCVMLCHAAPAVLPQVAYLESLGIPLKAVENMACEHVCRGFHPCPCKCAPAFAGLDLQGLRLQTGAASLRLSPPRLRCTC